MILEAMYNGEFYPCETVLLRPSMCSLLSFPFRGFGTLPNKQFSTDAPQRGRAKIRKWYPLPMLATNVFIL